MGIEVEDGRRAVGAVGDDLQDRVGNRSSVATHNERYTTGVDHRANLLLDHRERPSYILEYISVAPVD